MNRPWVHLGQQERDIFRTAIAFLEKRLAEEETVDWALRLESAQRIERMAVSELLNGAGARNLTEPWATTWRLIEESWSSDHLEDDENISSYDIRDRIRNGDRSGALVAAIVNLVWPHIKVNPIGSWRWQHVRKPKTPKTFRDLLSAHLTSGRLLNLEVLELTSLSDIPFLKSLATAIEGAVLHGLDIARRLGWDESQYSARLGLLYRVYYTESGGPAGRDSDPDTYHEGIAPSVKLLHAVVARIAELDPEEARRRVHWWSVNGSPVHVRLWAAMSRDASMTPARQVSDFLESTDDYKFWDLHDFPEIAELRARRFRDLAHDDQVSILARIRKFPPRNHWPRKAEVPKVQEARRYWAARELRRIEIAGNNLPNRDKSWLEEQVQQFPDLADIQIDEGFPEGVTVRSVPRNPDDQYDTLRGATRLRALEAALTTSRASWGEDPAARATDWLQVSGNALRVLDDLEEVGITGSEFPNVWNRFGWEHRPDTQEMPPSGDRDLEREATRVLTLLLRLSEEAILGAIEGISAWLDNWEKRIVRLPGFLPAWHRVWPIAVAATNSEDENTDDEELNLDARVDDDRDSMDSASLNSPTGKLVGLFLEVCPHLEPESGAFEEGSIEKQMRDTLTTATGRSRLIVQHRLIEWLPYFLHADNRWAQEHLMAPLLRDDADSLSLWRAIARRTRFTDVLQVIGHAMADRATDRRLGRETRRRLVFSLIVESLHALRENREPAVSNPRIQQLIRTLDDEVRASAANAVQKFVKDLSRAPDDQSRTDDAEQERTPSPAELFRTAAAPFLRNVWPQERSLTTPGVSKAFADLPATSGEAFPEAVEAVARFLVPFDCWSMLDYGLYGEDAGQARLSGINSEAKAASLLQLLDLTIGTNEGAIVPHDLSDALEQIQSIAPAMTTSASYRRLSTAARR